VNAIAHAQEAREEAIEAIAMSRSIAAAACASALFRHEHLEIGVERFARVGSLMAHDAEQLSASPARVIARRARRLTIHAGPSRCVRKSERRCAGASSRGVGDRSRHVRRNL